MAARTAPGARSVLRFTVRRPDHSPQSLLFHADLVERYRVHVPTGAEIMQTMEYNLLKTDCVEIIALNADVEGLTFWKSEVWNNRQSSQILRPKLELRPFHISDDKLWHQELATSPVLVFSNQTGKDAKVDVVYGRRGLTASGSDFSLGALSTYPGNEDTSTIYKLVNGTYYFSFTVYSPSTGEESCQCTPYGPYVITGGGGALKTDVGFTWVVLGSVPARFTDIRLYRTVAGSTTMKYAQTVSNGYAAGIYSWGYSTDPGDAGLGAAVAC